MGFKVTFLTWTKGQTHILKVWALHHRRLMPLECSLSAGSSCPAVASPWSRVLGWGYREGFLEKGPWEPGLEG